MHGTVAIRAAARSAVTPDRGPIPRPQLRGRQESAILQNSARLLRSSRRAILRNSLIPGRFRWSQRVAAVRHTPCSAAMLRAQ